jgi:tetratricopeptide (TPR) repeat protein
MKQLELDESDKALLEDAMQFNNKGKHKNALEILLQLEKKYTNSSMVCGILATTYHFLKDHENTLKYFAKTTLLNPNSELASLGLFHELWKIGKYKQAFTEMNRFLNSNEPKNYKVTLQEFFEQLSEETPKYQKEIIVKYYQKYLK